MRRSQVYRVVTAFRRSFLFDVLDLTQMTRKITIINSMNSMKSIHFASNRLVLDTN